MTGFTRSCLGSAALLIAALATPAFATDPESDGPRHNSPGSILIFPVFLTSASGLDTVITVTNINTSRHVNDNRFRDGDVLLHWTYVDGETWAESDDEKFLTPADTFSTFVSDDNFDSNSGWLWVEARDPENPELPIDFDYLIGDAILTSSTFNLDWQYKPYVFRGLPGGEHKEGDQSGNGHWYTDTHDDEDDLAEVNFNGEEYDYFPEFLYVDQFFGEGNPPEFNATFGNTLYLMSTKMDDTDLALLFYDNNETKYSRTGNFDCWFADPLSALSQIAKQENLRDKYNPQELKGIPYGWLRLEGSDPILGAFVQNLKRNQKTFIAGDALHFSGFVEATLERRF